MATCGRDNPAESLEDDESGPASGPNGTASSGSRRPPVKWNTENQKEGTECIKANHADASGTDVLVTQKSTLEVA